MIGSILCGLGRHKPVQIMDIDWKGKSHEKQDGRVKCRRCLTELPDGYGGIYRPVLFPRKMVDYWRLKPKVWEEPYEAECDYCPAPIRPGDLFFTISPVDTVTLEGKLIEELERRGHLKHLVYAPPVEWVPPEDQTLEESKP